MIKRYFHAFRDIFAAAIAIFDTLIFRHCRLSNIFDIAILASLCHTIRAAIFAAITPISHELFSDAADDIGCRRFSPLFAAG
jgi:hypothetical protein